MVNLNENPFKNAKEAADYKTAERLRAYADKINELVKDKEDR